MNRHIIKSALFAALSLMIAACSERIEFETGEGCPLSFDPTIYNPSADIETRGSMCNTPSDLYDIGSFNVSATNSDGSTFVGATTVSFTGNEWVMPGTAPLWKASEVKTFFASANTSSTGANVGVSSGKHTLTYTVPATASAQKDILLGYYKGNGDGKGRASIRFHHPLTAVKLQLAEDCEYTVTGIEISGIYASGTDEVTYTDGVPSNSWGSLLSGGTVSTTDIGETFILIPQTVAADAVDVTITAEGETLPFKGSIPAGEWKPGKTNTYTVSLKEGLIDFEITNASAQAYTENRDDNIFGGGPSPDLWVDLGMVSESGHPLYISKKNVKSIEDGIVYFADTEEESGNIDYTYHLVDGDGNYIQYTSQDGLECRIISLSEMASLVAGDSFIRSSSESVWTYTSKLTDESIEFPFNRGEFYLSTDHTHSSFWLTNENKISASSYSVHPNYMKVVYEDKSANILLGDFEIYSTGVGSLITLPDVLEYCHKVENNGYVSHYYGLQLLIRIKCANDYDLWSFDRVPGYSFVGFYPNDYIFLSQGSGTATVSHGSQNLTFNYNISCFVRGTQITLADGSRKAIEDITYNDEIQVWNFDEGHMDSAKVLWLTKEGLRNDHYIKCTFSDGTVLNVTGQNSHHKLYNCTDRYFEGVTKMEPGAKVFTENGVVTLVSKEWIEEEVEYYNLITERHINCFADGVLTSARYNNTYPIDDNMKFVRDDRKVRPYKEFKNTGISREWYNGLRLGEQTDSLDAINDYISKCEGQMADKPAPTLWQKFCTWWKSVFCR